MKLIIPAVFSVCCLTACQNPQQSAGDGAVLASINAQQHSQHGKAQRDYSVYTPSHHNKALADYAEQIVMDLRYYDSFEKPIAVSSFVEFDETLNTTTILGNQLAESVLIAMNNAGYPMLDITADDSIHIDASGSFVFSRKTKTLSSNICCIISGNLIYEPRGVRVNTKLFALENKRILATSSQLIPYFITEQYGSVVSR